MMEGIYLLLGTNLGDKISNLSLASSKIKDQIGEIQRKSRIYETDAWGKFDQPSFYNQVIKINSTFSPGYLLNNILKIENEIGRERIEKWGARIIDIDILYYGQQIHNTPSLKIPHPQIQNRRFTLAPLCEIASDFIHPTLKVTQRQLLEECKDELKVTSLDTSNF